MMSKTIALLALLCACNAGDSSIVSKYCAEDISKFCSDVEAFGTYLTILCLKENKKDVSDKCLVFLGTSTVGGCNADALTFCPEEREVKDIIHCLVKHKDELSDQCIQNIHSGDSGESLAQSRADRVRAFIIVISVIYLCIPAALSIWTYVFSLRFHESHMQLLQYEGLVDLDDSLDATRVATDITFSSLTYKIHTHSDWRRPLQSTTTTIIREISGQLLPSRVNAIMGPSGSGKTTLLRLLGGHTQSGEFSGVRYINGKKLPPSEYDSVMRKQGYVAQQSCLLKQLTVWQTIVYAAMLRLPHTLYMYQKLHRAKYTLMSMGLHHIADSIVGDGTGNCISGGQRRRLAIAQELLGNPSVLFLDEPTSGLDAMTSLQLMQILHKLSRNNTTVALSIHQPRAEVFDMFDSLLLLGQGGHLIYSGPKENAVNVISSCRSIVSQPVVHSNPGDFIIDILGLHNANCQEDQEEGECQDSQHHQPLNSRLAEDLAQHFKASRTHRKLMQRLERDAVSNVNNAVKTGYAVGQLMQLLRNVLSRSDETSYSALRMDDSTHAMHDNSSHGERDIETLTRENDDCGNGSINEGVDNTKPAVKCSTSKMFMHQLWMLFARRLNIIRSSNKDVFLSYLQNTLVAVVICMAFTYDVRTELEIPYQVFMLIFIISSYAMIVQYLVLIPEYMAERQVICNEREAAHISYTAYIVSALLTEVPRAIFLCCLLYGIVYFMHPLNPEDVYITFSFVCLMVGVSAWQSVINVASVVSDQISVAYTITFLLLGVGTLFGGLLVRLSRIPSIFHIVYYTSVTAITQRALIANDMECCYLTTTCNSLAQDLSQNHISMKNLTKISTDFCPIGLEFTGDGSDEGNLGRYSLAMLGLDQTAPVMSLLFLFWANILCRLLSVMILAIRTRLKYQLRYYVELDQRCIGSDQLSSYDDDNAGVEMSPITD